MNFKLQHSSFGKAISEGNRRKIRIAAIVALTLLFASLATIVIAHDQKDRFKRQADGYAEALENARKNENSNKPLSHVPCVQGVAGEFPCDKVDLLSWLPSSNLGLSFVNDIWGWTDPETRNDYALVGGGEGMVVVEISDPKRPVVMGILPTKTTGSFFWRDIKVYANHAFIVSEDPDHGMQVFDLTQLRGISSGPVTFAETAHYGGVGHSHNIAINEDTGFAYIVGSDACSGGLHMVDISNPTSPSFAGCFAEHDYIHDTQCVVYTGPDADHQGREICFSSAAEENPNGRINTVSIVDVTDKNNPVSLARVDYPTDGYSHQGWLTPDQAYFLHNDELDEAFGEVSETTTRIWDVRDLDAPVVLAEVGHGTTAIGHNAYTEGRYVHESNYTAGLRIFDITKVGQGTMKEVAYFDMYPENDNTSFEGGTWSNYPFFSQKGIVAVSSMDRGLFILQPRLGKSGN